MSHSSSSVFSQNSFAAKVHNDDYFTQAQAVIKQAQDANLETIRIVFVDQHGITRGKTIMLSALKSAFESGVSMTSTLLLKDTSHATVFPVWEDDAGMGKGVMTGASDFLMLPDPTTFKVLPWTGDDAPTTGWIISDIFQTDGTPITFSTREILRKALSRLHKKGLEFVSGLEVEFYVLNVDNPNLDHKNANRPEDPPQTSLLSHGYQYLTENRVDQIDDVLETLRINAQKLGLPLRSMESEFGPSQFEFTFEPSSGMATADLMVLFRNMVKQVCQRHGLHATFMSRPSFKSAMGSGWHLHQSLVDLKTGVNNFIPAQGQDLTELNSQWIAGILKHAKASCLLTTPTVNGYKRYAQFGLAPDRIQWGHDNRGSMLRSLAKAGDKASRVENRIGEPAANPYLYLASQILCGLDGIDNNLAAPAPVETPYSSDDTMLPNNLGSAITAFEESKFYRQSLGDEFVDYLCRIKTAEWNRYLGTVSEWEQREYFSLF